MASLTVEQARSYLSRWEEVERFEREQLRITSMTVKFRQLAALMASAVFRQPQREAHDTELTARWTAIRGNSRG